uniref:hypothetical protein n=1 Tax=Sphingomonas bacterium TaxID=1895847 RepID=UPI0015752D03
MIGPADVLPYLAAGLTLLSGIVGFFWARGGERNRVGGIGWAALALLVTGGVVTIVQTRVQAKRTAAAAA